MKHLSFLFCLWCFSCGKTDSTPPFKPLGNSIAYIINGGDNSLTIVDLNNFERKQTLFLKNSPALFPHHIYISPLSNTLSIATSDYDFSLGHAGIHNYIGKGYVLLLNSETGELKRNIELPAPAHNAVPSADGKEVWVALSIHAGKVMIFDTEAGELKGEIGVGSDPSELILAKNGEYAILSAEESSFVTIIDTKTYKIVKQIKVDPNPTNVWLGYDQNTVFVENANLKSLNIIDLNSLSVVEYLDFDFTPGYSAYNSKTMEIWVCEKNGKNINIFEKENGKWKKKHRIETELDPHQIMFIENFEKALVINQKSNSLQIINVKSREIIKKIFTGLKPNGIAIKP